jgi:hypothetical protein
MNLAIGLALQVRSRAKAANLAVLLCVEPFVAYAPEVTCYLEDEQVDIAHPTQFGSRQEIGIQGF